LPHLQHHLAYPVKRAARQKGLIGHKTDRTAPKWGFTLPLKRLSLRGTELIFARHRLGSSRIVRLQVDSRDRAERTCPMALGPVPVA
jgi:hypothetical protein